MTKLKAKVELLNRITALGFTFDEAQQLRRIQMVLHRWAELECGDSNNCASWSVERDETTGKPFCVFHPYNGKSYRQPIADREAGALKRLKAIVDARNAREYAGPMAAMAHTFPDFIHAYYQTDPRGCALYLVKASNLPEATDETIRLHSGEWPLKSEETRLQWKLSCCYTRGLAVCA